MPGFISDEEMAALEAKQKPPKTFISDEEMAKIEASQSPQEQFTKDTKEFSQRNDIGKSISSIPGGILNVATKAIPKIVSDIPAATGAMFSHPIEYGKGVIKGAVNAGKGILGIHKASDVIENNPDQPAFTPSNEPQRLGAEYGNLSVNAASMLIPGGKVLNQSGKTIENNLGKTLKLGELKIPQSIAKKSYGKDLMEKKKSIVNDIADFGATHGNNESAANDAYAMAGQRFDKADEIGTQLANDPTVPKKNPVDVAMKGIDVNKIASTGKRKQAQAIIDNVLEDMVADGHGEPVTLDQLIKAKQNLNNDGLLFKNGPAPSDADALDRAVRKKMYLNLVDAIGEVSPEIKAMNTEGKRLLDVHAALSNAASRNANHDIAGLTDFILGGEMLAHPGSWSVAAPLLVAKKGLANGRAGNMAINLGRKLQGKQANSIEGTLDAIRNKPQPPLQEFGGEVKLPSRSSVPAYFRKGFNPEKANESAQAATSDRAIRNKYFTRTLSKSEGEAIAKEIGAHFNGIQKGVGNIPDQYMFTSLDPKAESSFMGIDVPSAAQALQRVRDRFKQ
jgi:hypothetical protein